MHGRVKVKTTEQQEQEKKVEREAKLKAYRKAMSLLLSRRSEGLKDSNQLTVSAQVLQSNPDISTLWNIRKEVLLHMLEQGRENRTDKGGDLKFDKDGLLQKELELTQQCLMTNPKSYGAWHHRTWSLEQMDKPDWDRELGLCQRYLKLDERNFHCWDYRKWVAAKAEVPCSSELEFTTEKIEENFSNYSAWHYRSKLLPLLHPGNHLANIKEEVSHSELDLVQNAAFTDPEDSSAWFYHTWLLGRECEKTCIIFCLVERGTLTLSFTNPVQCCELRLSIDGSPVALDWSGDQPRFNSLWRAKVVLNPGVCTEISYLPVPLIIPGGSNQSEEEQHQSLKFSVVGGRQLIKYEGWKTTYKRFINLPNQTTKEVLQRALENCCQLLELEPSSKWTLYTKLLILLALDSHTNHQEIMQSLEQLVEIDSIRKNFYSDLKGRLRMEFKIETADPKLVAQQKKGQRSSWHSQYLPAFYSA